VQKRSRQPEPETRNPNRTGTVLTSYHHSHPRHARGRRRVQG
jgi:hypothetical protein